MSPQDDVERRGAEQRFGQQSPGELDAWASQQRAGEAAQARHLNQSRGAELDGYGRPPPELDSRLSQVNGPHYNQAGYIHQELSGSGGYGYQPELYGRGRPAEAGGTELIEMNGIGPRAELECSNVQPQQPAQTHGGWRNVLGIARRPVGP